MEVSAAVAKVRQKPATYPVLEGLKLVGLLLTRATAGVLKVIKLVNDNRRTFIAAVPRTR